MIGVTFCVMWSYSLVGSIDGEGSLGGLEGGYGTCGGII